MAKKANFYSVLSDAINDLVENGFDSEEQLEKWMKKIRAAAESVLPSEKDLDKLLRESLIKLYKKLVEDGDITRQHEDVELFTIKKVRGKLKDELDKRIMASASLIRLNRDKAIDSTVQRFAGWATSIPTGGTKQTDRMKTKDGIRKALTSLPFEERRVLIDQGHKLTASISEVIAVDGGAIAMIWHSHWRQPGYDYREDHRERDEHVYAIKGNWFVENGLMKPGPDGWYDDITKVAEEPFCRCFAEWIYNLRSLPKNMVTVKGMTWLAQARAKLSA